MSRGEGPPAGAKCEGGPPRRPSPARTGFGEETRKIASARADNGIVTPSGQTPPASAVLRTRARAALRRLAVAAAALAVAPAPAGAQGAPFVEVSGDYSPVSISTTDTTWRVGRVSGGWLDPGRSGVTAALERHARGRLVDWTGVATAFRRMGDWTLSGSAGVTTRPDFLYRYSLEGEFARRIAGPVVVHGAYRHLSFAHADVRIVQPALSVYFGDGELHGRLFLVRNLTLDRDSQAVVLRGTVPLHPRVKLGGGAALGNRIFDVAALSDAEADGWAAFGFARFALARSWSVDVGLGRAQEDPFFSQRTLSLAVRRTFQ